MSIVDPEKEKRRLAEFYAGQMDGELEKVATEAYELTEIAREALRAELTKGGLATTLVEKHPVSAKIEPRPRLGDPPTPPPEAEPLPEDGDVDLRKMVTIRQFRDLPEALLAKGSLDSAEIECVLVDDNVVRLDWFWSNLMGGVKLLVNAEDAEAANEVLSQPIPENLDVSGVGNFEQPHCPKCGSLDVNFREIAPAAYVSMMVSVPLPFRRRAWRCHNCDVEWEDDADTAPEESEA